MQRLVWLASIAVFFVATFVLWPKPKLDRDWEHGFSRMPVITDDSGIWKIKDLRSFSFEKDGPKVEQWDTRRFNVEDLKEIWFFVEPFEGSDLFAHSFLSFVFEGETQQTISVSVEARKEVGEAYSAILGVFNAFELLYVWSTEKDILTRIAINLDHPLYAYKMDLTPEQSKAIFEHFAERTNTLAKRPRFYNTLTSNCTNELAKAVNDAFPGAIGWHPSFVLTGGSAKHLHELGYVEGGEAFNAITAKANIKELVEANANLAAPGFSKTWRRSFNNAD